MPRRGRQGLALGLHYLPWQPWQADLASEAPALSLEVNGVPENVARLGQRDQALVSFQRVFLLKTINIIICPITSRQLTIVAALRFESAITTP
jgi:hypothetical protein